MCTWYFPQLINKKAFYLCHVQLIPYLCVIWFAEVQVFYSYIAEITSDKRYAFQTFNFSLNVKRPVYQANNLHWIRLHRMYNYTYYHKHTHPHTWHQLPSNIPASTPYFCFHISLSPPLQSWRVTFHDNPRRLGPDETQRQPSDTKFQKLISLMERTEFPGDHRRQAGRFRGTRPSFQMQIRLKRQKNPGLAWCPKNGSVLTELREASEGC